MSFSDQETRADEYAQHCGIQIKWDQQLGFGNDGSVWPTDRRTAIKSFERESNYTRERNCYQRLKQLAIRKMGEFTIPRLIGCDDDLWIVEMGVVFPPFLLDFGKAYLDQPPDYSPEALADWEAERREIFGDRWGRVQEALSWLRSYGIYYYDAKVGNFTFADEREEAPKT